MKKKVLTAILFWAITATTNAALQISIATDKSIYQIGETIGISITVFNSGTTFETLYGGFYFTTYIMDGVYDWADRSGPQVVIHTTFLPGETKRWEMAHGFYEWQAYPLAVGTHSIVGGAGFTLLSEPVEFQVIPEPVTLLLFGVGVVLFIRKRQSDLLEFYHERV